MWTEQVELNMDKGGQTRCQERRQGLSGRWRRRCMTFPRRRERWTKVHWTLGEKQSSEEFHDDY